MYKNQRFSKGFNLIEIAIVLGVLGIIVAFATGMLGTILERNKLSNTRESVKDAKEALIGFALKNNRFPCPDTFDDSNYDGQEDCPYSPTSPDPSTDDYKDTKLPYITLGVKGKDAYLQQLYYDINVSLTDASTLTGSYEFCYTARNILLNPSWPVPPRITMDEGSNWSSVAAVVLSTGENKSLDPAVNNNNDERSYESKGITTNYDDIVEWVDLGNILAQKNCQDCTSYTVYNWRGNGTWSGLHSAYVFGGIYTDCTEIAPGAAFNVRLGDVVIVYGDNGCSSFYFYGLGTVTQETATVTYWKAQDLDKSEDLDGSWGTVPNDCIVNAKHGIT